MHREQDSFLGHAGRLLLGLLLGWLSLTGCGGGSSTSGGGLPQSSTVPVALLEGWVPADTAISQYKSYTFSASATDANIGGSITEFRWDFGDGSPVQVTAVVLAGGKATTTCPHAYLTSGTGAVSVVAKNAAGLLSAAATRALTITAMPSPISVAFVSPAAPITLNAALGGTASVTFAVNVVNVGTGTVSASGIRLNPGDPTATQTTPTSGGGGSWSLAVTYPAATAIGTRTATPTLTVVDSNNLSSASVTGPLITIKTVSLTNTPPIITLAATPGIVAGPNAAWQNVAIDFKATATDPDGDVLTYAWTFGDGGKGDVAATQVAAVLDQTHTYANAGIYPVTFTADDGRAGGTKSITLNLNILPNTKPTLTVVQAPIGQPYANVPLTFTATVTDPDGDVPWITWNFGDGSALVTGQNPPTHSFAAAGITLVTATADDLKGGTATWSTALSVLANRPPVAALSTTPASLGNLFQSKAYPFAATATDPDAGDSIAQYQWDFGDDSAIQNTVLPNSSHTYLSTFTGTAAVRVRAVDNHGSAGDFSPAVAFTVQATSLPLGAFLNPLGPATYNTESGAAGVAITYIVSMTNPNGAGFLPLSSVTFDPGESIGTATVLSQNANGDGTYTYRVQYKPAASTSSRIVVPSVVATDLQGIRSLVRTGGPVTIVTQASNRPPVVTLVSAPRVAAGTNATWQNVDVVFTGAASDPDNDPLTYAWDFGDGTVLPGLTGSSALVQSHKYVGAGLYSVKLTADDGRTSGIKIADLTMNVLANTAPVVVVTKDSPSGNPTKYQRVTLSAAVTDTDTSTVTWNFGDGSASATGTTVVHQFLAAGLTNVTATADDGKGGVTTSAVLQLTIVENNPPVAAVTPSVPVSPLYQNKGYSFRATASDLDGGDTIASYEWDFGNGLVVAGGANQMHAFPATVTGGVPVKARAIDSRGAVGDWSPAVSFTVVATPLPVVTFTSPEAPVLNVDLSGTVTQAFTLTATNPRASTPGVTDPIPVGNLTFLANDALASVVTAVSSGGGSYTFTVQYTGEASAHARTSTPTAYATDTLAIKGHPASGPLVTVNTLGANHPPVITLTNPATDGTVAYTSKPFHLGFTLTDADNDAVTYAVDWGDGTATASGTPVGDFGVGVGVSASHTYADAFTASSQGVSITVTATDNRSASATATPRTRQVVVTYNTLPRAAITSPQSSGSAPTGLPVGISAPFVVVPLNGRVTFAGTASLPASLDPISSTWTFPGGVPSSGSGSAPGEVAFAGTVGAITPQTVTYTVRDALGRTASATKQVLVDGLNTQAFNLSFLHRLKSDNNGTSSTALVTTAPNGLGASVQIYQDGQSSTYAVQNQASLSGARATVAIPVRSDLPFWVKLPPIGADSLSYLLRIPNAPTGPYADPALAATLPVGSSSFSFASATAPWDPTLQIVTAQGFAAETNSAPRRMLSGSTDLVLGVWIPSERWLDRLSVPANDATPAITWTQSSNDVGQLSGIEAYQLFAEWPTLLLTRATLDLGESTPDTTLVAGTSADLGFVMDYGTYATDTPATEKEPPKAAESKTFAAFSMQAFRAPAGSTDPYLLSAGWGGSAKLDSTATGVHKGLNPLPVDVATRTFLGSLVNGSPGASPLAGGISNLTVPFAANDPDRVPLSLAATAANLRSYSGLNQVFSYSEYLWSTVWARPLVLNSAQPDHSKALGAFPYFRYSSPTAWPKAAGIGPDNSAFDLTARGGGVFDGVAPVGLAGAAAPATGVGRFFWTAYTPSYGDGASSGAAIARTWLADDATQQVPTSFSGAAAGDATVALGFMVPQDTMVDKRGRNADGSLDGNALGGYRVTWYNPTRDANGDPVAPDFWVVELDTGSKKHFLLPGGFPVGTQIATTTILTDARTYLPSGNAPGVGPAPPVAPATATADRVAPGYCWFDIPLELRPTDAAALRVFAVKAVLKNHPVAMARVLNRTDWIDAIKTATATMKMLVSGGANLSYAYKVPFNYGWDIVIANGPVTVVAP